MRRTVADLTTKALPVAPNYGPPLPNFFKIRWPEMIWSRMPKVGHSIGVAYSMGLTKLSSIIRGY